MAAVFDSRFAPEGLTQAQFRTLLAIAEAGKDGIAPSDLAAQLLIDRASVTSITARLQSEGWVERRPGENRRTHRLMVTAEGLTRMHRVTPHAITLADETLAEFDPEELRQFRALLEKLEAKVRATDLKRRENDAEEVNR